LLFNRNHRARLTAVAPDVHRFLAEFLSDRVVNPATALADDSAHHLRTPQKSRKVRASIWTPEGSPLKLWTKQAKRKAGWLGQRGPV
jgi:ferrochelatase